MYSNIFASPNVICFVLFLFLFFFLEGVFFVLFCFVFSLIFFFNFFFHTPYYNKNRVSCIFKYSTLDMVLLKKLTALF